MILPASMKFNLGRIVITPAALEAIPADDICNAINRHVCGDFGDLTAADLRENELALRAGLRLLSVYHATNGTKFYVLTEACRTITTILLPADY
ncbi:MAG: hypothetical protein WCH99_13700 [Verrucomicrobiota bacterium]